MEQRTAEWYAARLGKVLGRGAAALVAAAKLNAQRADAEALAHVHLARDGRFYSGNVVVV